MVQKGGIRAELGGPRSIFFMNLHLCRFQNHASHRGRGAFFQKIGRHFVKKGVRSMASTKKTADRIRNWQNYWNDAYTHFCWRGSGGEKCTALQPEAIFWRGHGAQKWRSERPKERQEQIKLQKMLLLRPFGGHRNKNFDENCLKSFCRNMFPARAGTTILKKCDAKIEQKHDKHKRGSLKLAFLMHIRNKSRR